MRLHKFIAECGVTSRRNAEELIAQGKVELNGETVTEMGVRVAPETDEVRVEGRKICRPKLHYILMNKPVGYVSTTDDPQGRPTVMALLPDMGTPLKPVGRLDMNSKGLLIFTNDGDLAARLTHPRYGVEKEYRAVVHGVPDESDLERLRKGVYVEGRKTAPATVTLGHVLDKGKRASLSLVLHEGRKRQVRLMCEAVGHPIVELERVRIGPFKLRGMAPGQCRRLSIAEVSRLRAKLGLD